VTETGGIGNTAETRNYQSERKKEKRKEWNMEMKIERNWGD